MIVYVDLVKDVMGGVVVWREGLEQVDDELEGVAVGGGVVGGGEVV